MRYSKWLFVVASFCWACGNGAPSNARSSPDEVPSEETEAEESEVKTPPNTDFGVEIVQMVKGAYKQRSHKLAAGRVLVTAYSLNGEPPKAVFDASLSEEQTAELAKLIAGLRLDALEDVYESNVRAEGHLVFNLSSGDVSKSIEVHSFKQPDLWKLASFVNSVVPHEHEVWYGRDGVDE